MLCFLVKPLATSLALYFFMDPSGGTSAKRLKEDDYFQFKMAAL